MQGYSQVYSKEQWGQQQQKHIRQECGQAHHIQQASTSNSSQIV